MAIRRRELLSLYEWAVRYARVQRSELVEVEDAVQEMMVAVMESRFKSREYAKGVMRNKLFNLFRHGKVVRNRHPYIADVDTDHWTFSDENGLEAKDLVQKLMAKSVGNAAVVLDHLLKGRTVEEIARKERLTVRTVYRYISKARALAISL